MHNGIRTKFIGVGHDKCFRSCVKPGGIMSLNSSPQSSVAVTLPRVDVSSLAWRNEVHMRCREFWLHPGRVSIQEYRCGCSCGIGQGGQLAVHLLLAPGLLYIKDLQREGELTPRRFLTSAMPY